MRCQCPQCCETPSPTWTPEYRLRCEATFVLRLPLAARREYLAAPLVAKRVEALKAWMLRLHAQRQ